MTGIEATQPLFLQPCVHDTFHRIPDPDALLLFTPVPAQRVIANGWSAEVQRAFVAALARVGTVAAAARSVARSPRSAYQLRARAGADSGFVRAWDAALARPQLEALDIAIDRGFAGHREPVWYRGQQVGWRIRQDNTLLLAALRALDGISGRFARTDLRDPTEVLRGCSRGHDRRGRLCRARATELHEHREYCEAKPRVSPTVIALTHPRATHKAPTPRGPFV